MEVQLKTDEKELFWAAGFLEGEGTFAVDCGSPSMHAVQIFTKEPLDRLSSCLGGSVRVYNREFARRKGAKVQDGWIWRLHSADSVVAMIRLYPLMSERRREQIGLVFESILKNARTNSKPINTLIQLLKLNPDRPEDQKEDVA